MRKRKPLPGLAQPLGSLNSGYCHDDKGEEDPFSLLLEDFVKSSWVPLQTVASMGLGLGLSWKLDIHVTGAQFCCWFVEHMSTMPRALRTWDSAPREHPDWCGGNRHSCGLRNNCEIG